MTFLTDSVAALRAQREQWVETKLHPAPAPAAAADPQPAAPTQPVSTEIPMSFLSKLKSALSSMWKKVPAVAVAISSAINNLVPIVEQLDTIIDPKFAADLNPILDKIKVGISALKTTVQDAGGSAANVQSIASAIQSHLSDLVSAAQVKDPAMAAKISEVTTVIAAAVSDIHASA